MKYIIKKKMKTILVSVISMITLVGCSNTQKYTGIDNIAIEQVSSMDAKITHTGLYRTETKNVLIRGELKRQFFVRNAQIPGHLRVELLNLKGKVFKEVEFNYGRKSNNLKKLSFSIPVPVEPALISKVRVIHHQTRSHVLDANNSIWRDVDSDMQEVEIKI
jgi:hypothetical protein